MSFRFESPEGQLWALLVSGVASVHGYCMIIAMTDEQRQKLYDEVVEQDSARAFFAALSEAIRGDYSKRFQRAK